MRLRIAFGLLLGATILLAGCSESGQTETTLAPEISTTTVEKAPEVTEVTPTTVITEVSSISIESTTTTTLPQFVDLPDPKKMFSDALGGEAVTLPDTEVCDSKKCDPGEGQVGFKRFGLNGTTPGEVGIAYVIGHVNRGHLFFNLIDDNDSDYADDYGLQIGETVSFELMDSTVCTYGVIPPLLDETTEHVNVVEGQPFVYWNKDPNVKLVPLNKLMNDERFAGRSLLVMAVSYGGPNGNEKTGGHRDYNGILFAELITC